MQPSQPVISSPQISRSRWTAVWTIGGGIVIGILVSWFGVTSWQAYLNTFFPVQTVDLSTLKPSMMPLYLASSTHSDVTTTAKGDQSQQNQESPQAGLDDISREMLKNFGVSSESWMKSAELFELPDNEKGYLFIRGTGLNDLNKRTMERVVVYGLDFPHPFLDEQVDDCSSVSATTTDKYFMTSVMHSPCEAGAEYKDAYYDWSGKRLVSIEHGSRASDFSFITEKDSGEVSLTFGKKCSSEGVPYDQIWDKKDQVLLKTSITGLVISNIFHKLPVPLEVSCGEYYGGHIVDPMIGSPSFDGRYIKFNLTRELDSAQAKIDIADPENVSFNIK